MEMVLFYALIKREAIWIFVIYRRPCIIIHIGSGVYRFCLTSGDGKTYPYALLDRYRGFGDPVADVRGPDFWGEPANCRPTTSERRRCAAMLQPKIIPEKTDLRHLDWTRVRGFSGPPAPSSRPVRSGMEGGFTTNCPTTTPAGELPGTNAQTS